MLELVLQTGILIDVQCTLCYIIYGLLYCAVQTTPFFRHYAGTGPTNRYCTSCTLCHIIYGLYCAVQTTSFFRYYAGTCPTNRYCTSCTLYSVHFVILSKVYTYCAVQTSPFLTLCWNRSYRQVCTRCKGEHKGGGRRCWPLPRWFRGGTTVYASVFTTLLSWSIYLS